MESARRSSSSLAQEINPKKLAVVWELADNYRDWGNRTFGESNNIEGFAVGSRYQRSDQDKAD
jgi:hypothetical protein